MSQNKAFDKVVTLAGFVHSAHAIVGRHRRALKFRNTVNHESTLCDCSLREDDHSSLILLSRNEGRLSAERRSADQLKSCLRDTTVSWAKHMQPSNARLAVADLKTHEAGPAAFSRDNNSS